MSTAAINATQPRRIIANTVLVRNHIIYIYICIRMMLSARQLTDTVLRIGNVLPSAFRPNTIVPNSNANIVGSKFSNRLW